MTAVEWMAEKVGHNSLMRLADYYEILEQALAIEKEQIISAVDNLSVNQLGEFVNGEEYYQETYGK